MEKWQIFLGVAVLLIGIIYGAVEFVLWLINNYAKSLEEGIAGSEKYKSD